MPTVAPRVSVIIPAYNQGRFLRATIENALAVRHPNVEVVVVNDGSTDETDTIAQEYGDRSGFKYVCQENRGLSAARNRGIEESSGDYLLFLDADDLVAPNMVSVLLSYFDVDESLGFVYCDTAHIDDTGATLDDSYSVGAARRQTSGDILDSLLDGGYFPVHAALVKRSAQKDVGEFDTSLTSHEDYDFWLRMIGRGFTARYVDEKLVYYRRYPGSMSGDERRMRETRKTILARLAREIPDRVTEHLIDLQARCVAVSETGVDPAVADPAANSFSFIASFDDRRVLQGDLAATAIWEATIDDVTRKGILVNPDTVVEFRPGTGAPGVLNLAVALHPDTWDKPETRGGAVFLVSADERLALQVVINPFEEPADRRWHEFTLALPAAPDAHRIVLRTRAVGPVADYRWCMFRTPVFRW